MLGGDSVYLFLKPIGFYRGAPVHAHLRLKGTRWYKRRLFFILLFIFFQSPSLFVVFFSSRKTHKGISGGKKNRYPTMEFFNSKKKYMQGLIYSSFFFIFSFPCLYFSLTSSCKFIEALHRLFAYLKTSQDFVCMHSIENSLNRCINLCSYLDRDFIHISRLCITDTN